jgi:putative phage-type endonuclease
MRRKKMINEIAYASREEWINLRRQYIGGSDAGAVVGLNPYKSAYTLWAEKTGKVPEFEGNLTTEVGSYLEDFVAKLFERETCKKVRRKNRMIVNAQYPFACADVDRVVVGENAILECKTTNSYPAMKKFKNGEYPESWYCQMTHYLAVGGYDRVYLGVLIGCREFKVFVLDRDNGEIEALMTAESVFWYGNVLKGIPPSIDGAESTSDTLTAIYPESNDNTVNLMAYEADIKQYMTYTSLIKDVEKQRDEVANRIKAFLGESGRGESDSFRVSYVTTSRSTFDSKRFAADNPSIDLSKYYKTSTYRTFKVSER